MIRRLLFTLYYYAVPKLRHPTWLVRRAAQVFALGTAAGLSLGQGKSGGDRPDQGNALVRQLWSSTGLRDFVKGSGVIKRSLGQACRYILLRLSVSATLRAGAGTGENKLTLRIASDINQRTLRNLLIWQNQISHSRSQKDFDLIDVDVILAIDPENRPRLFDLVSVALMLENIRNFALHEDLSSAEGTALIAPTEPARWDNRTAWSDLDEMPCDFAREVAINGSPGGIKLLPQGRKRANDFLKLVLPGRLVIAVGMREWQDGAVEPGELELWLPLLMERRWGPNVAFVVLNRIAPMQWRDWGAHIRFARHQGLTLQDALCLAQIADGYVGVLDLFGLAAHSAGKPGVYIPLEEDGVTPEQAFDANLKNPAIMVGSADRARIGRAMETFISRFPKGS